MRPDKIYKGNALKILLVEDDNVIANAILKTIVKTEFRVEHVTLIEEAKHVLETDQCNLMILDLGLPDGDGLRFLKKIRTEKKQIPVLILTARDRLHDRLSGLDSGADDYLAKPFDVPELLARIRAIKRRLSGRATNLIQYGSLKVMPDYLSVSLKEKAISLPVSQFRLLQYLLEEHGKVKTKQQIIETLYSWDNSVEDNTIEVYVSQLRKTLWPDLIKTVRGIGYFIPQESQIENQHL